MKLRIILGTSFVCLFIAVLALSPVCAASAPTHFQGKTITLIVATKPGGGYDLSGRLVAKYMGQVLGANVIVKNVPGAGHIIGCNEIFRAKPDGLTFGVFNRALLFAQLAEVEVVKFDLLKMSWIGSPCEEPYVLVANARKFNSFSDAVRAEKFKISSAGIGSQSHIYAVCVKKMLNLKNWDVIPGYAGGEAEMAILRGEIDAVFGSYSSMAEFIEAGHGKVLLVASKNPPKGYESKRIPFLRDIVKGKYGPLVPLFEEINIFARPFAGPPGIPADKLNVLREAFRQAVSNPEFKRVIEKAGGQEHFVSGAELGAILSSLVARITPDLREVIRESYYTK